MKKANDARKKKVPQTDPVVSSEMMESAKRSLDTDRLWKAKSGTRCVVCGSECAPNSSEQLCWVCRRLKISAWGDSDQQASAQE